MAMTDAEWERITKKRKAYYVPHVPDKNGDFIPGIAVEGEAGYYQTDWNWGKNRDLAQRCADEKNAALGVSKEDAERIILSSMFAKK